MIGTEVSLHVIGKQKVYALQWTYIIAFDTQENINGMICYYRSIKETPTHKGANSYNITISYAVNSLEKNRLL